MINYRRYRRKLEKMYEDRATISRFEEYKTDWGETRKTDKLVPVHLDVPCRISQRQLASNNQTETVNPIEYGVKLFISPDIEIRQGDTIEVTRQGITRAYTAGEPFIYGSHQEVSLERKDIA